MIRRTKIVATLGPATDKPEILRELIAAGVDVVRLNFSHGLADDHLKRAALVSTLAAELGKTVAILADLQGPKIRIARFATGKVNLSEGETFFLDADLGDRDGNEHGVGIDYKELPQDCDTGDQLLLDDGRIVLKVVETSGNRISSRVEIGGVLSDNKGINRQGGGLSAPALTEKDKADIETAAKIGVDFVAVSFPRDAGDMNVARELLRKAGSEAALVAKIERAETVRDAKSLDGIILASDAVMVARGDLGVEIGDAELVGVQKRIIARARALNRAVITATQMMESMISNPLPTRAEVMDVANAVLDGTDAVMCSAETAAGDYPVKTVEAMVRVILGAERERSIRRSDHRLDETFNDIGESIALAAMYTANHLPGVKAIISLTESGTTPLLMSRISSGLPICAFSRHPRTQRRVALYRGVVVIPFEAHLEATAEAGQVALRELVSRDIVEKGDYVILSQGDNTHVQGGTNTMKVLVVE